MSGYELKLVVVRDSVGIFISAPGPIEQKF